jgi:hypothetical protein
MSSRIQLYGVRPHSLSTVTVQNDGQRASRHFDASAMPEVHYDEIKMDYKQTADVFSLCSPEIFGKGPVDNDSNTNNDSIHQSSSGIDQLPCVKRLQCQPV